MNINVNLYHPILLEIAAEFGIQPFEVTAHANTKRSHRGARYKAAYRLANETDLSVRDIGRLLGYSDWSGVNHAVATYAKSIGKPIATTTELRHGVPARAIDWKRLAAHLCATYRAKDFTKAGVSRMVWMALMRGQRVNTDDFLFVMKRLGLTIEQYATSEYLATRSS